jgi:hypothetical protein
MPFFFLFMFWFYLFTSSWDKSQQSLVPASPLALHVLLDRWSTENGHFHFALNAMTAVTFLR